MASRSGRLPSRFSTAFTLTLAGLLVTGCGQETEAPYAYDTTENDEKAPSPDAYVLAPGVYSIESSDGSLYFQMVIEQDGTYSTRNPDGETIVTGRWRDDRGRACFDPSGAGEDKQERCWINSSLSEDGTFTTTGVDGSDSYTVRPVAN